MNIQPIDGACYHAAYGFMHHLQGELSEVYRTDGDLLTVLGPQRQAYWIRNIWQKPFIAEFDSISQAARILKDIQRNWAAYPLRLARRSTLIQEAMPAISAKPRLFPFTVPTAPMGAFTLLDEHRLLASADCSSPWPLGRLDFLEDKEGPPSRAYRKLWEALLMHQHLLGSELPASGSVCLDAGAAPGGWTWALASLGAQVTAIDRADLDSSVAAMPGVRCLRGNAFALKPEETGPVDWLCSDVICYPQALYDWVSLWLESGQVANAVCTIKMQGHEWDKNVTESFAAIPGSKVLHLWHNKHELTWLYRRP